MTSVLVVVLNWNGINDTQECLESLFKQTYGNFKIAVVDNGSIDNSVEILEGIAAENEKLIVIKNSKNLGFAGGVNTGIKYGIDKSYDAVTLFNNDAVADKDWLSHLVEALTSTKAAITTGLLLHRDGKTIDSTGDFYTTWGIPFPRSRGLNTKDAPASENVFSASGGGSLYKTSLFKEIGLFDPNFFAYYEDVDVSFRTQLAGHKIYYTDKALAYHKQGATSSKIPGFTVYQTFKNLPLLFWKDVPTKLLLPIGLRFILMYVLIFANALRHGSFGQAFKGVLASIYYFWKSALWQRIKIQRSKKVSANYIWSILYHDLPPEQTGMRKFRKLFTGKQ